MVDRYWFEAELLRSCIHEIISMHFFAHRLHCYAFIAEIFKADQNRWYAAMFSFSAKIKQDQLHENYLDESSAGVGVSSS